VGKSTLLNALAGGERAIVSPVAGTTRDSVDETVIHEGREFVFVDTAGIRRKGKTELMAEKLSVVMARRHIRTAHVALLVLDATEGPVASDATIGGYAHEEGRALVIVVNKWDLVGDTKRKECEQAIRDAFKFLEYAPIVFLSAKQKRGVRGLFKHIASAYEEFDKRVPTGELNRFAETIDLGYQRRILYMTQPTVRPPTFVLFMDSAEPLHFSTERNIVNRLRGRFGFVGTPVILKVKSSRTSHKENRERNKK
jgi:GTP-binding protein